MKRRFSVGCVGFMHFSITLFCSNLNSHGGSLKNRHKSYTNYTNPTLNLDLKGYRT